MDISSVSSPNAPAAIGPYSQAIVSGEWVFTSGQIALDANSGELVGQDIEQQTHQVMKNLEHVLAAAGTGFTKVVKATLYLVDLADFSHVNRIYGTYFKELPPARSTVQVAALPRGARIEIELVARR
jgi:2-iminobutanoate/2-iminopropanoate deaminase